MLVPACDAVMVQLPVLFRVTLAEETPLLSGGDWLPMEQGPVALKLTCCALAAPFVVSAVAVTVCGPGNVTELGRAPRTMF